MTVTEDLTARLDRLEAANADLAARNAVLADRIDDLEGRSQGAPAAVPARAGAAADTTLDRRRLLKRGAALAGAAAAGAVLLDAAPSAAADGNAVILGGLNRATSGTYLNQSASTNGFGLSVSSNGESAGDFHATGALGTGLIVEGNGAHMRFVRSGRQSPINDATPHVRGEVVMDTYSNLWYCAGDGTPGVWTTLAGNGSTGSFFPLPAPVRVYDSRPGTNPTQGPKTPLTGTRTIDLTVNGSTLGTFSRTAVVNVLLVNAANAPGNFTIWAGGQAKPLSNTLVWGGSAGRFSTLAVTRLGSGKVQINASHRTDVVLDVVGHYF